METENVRAQLQQALADLTSTSQTLEGEGAGESSELSHFDQHPADTASELSDNDREIALLEANDARKAEIEAALARLDDGTYGRCVDCGKQIPPARLEVRPEAARCVEDQERFEATTA